MIDLRLSLTAILAIGLTACAPSGGEDGEARGVPPGFELAMAERGSSGQTVQVIDLSVAEFQELRASDDIWLIDVRTAEEVADGMIAGADHIPLAEFEPDSAMLAAAKGREIILYCRSGRRSGIAAQKLAGIQDKPVRHLAGGYIAWSETGGETQ